MWTAFQLPRLWLVAGVLALVGSGPAAAQSVSAGLGLYQNTTLAGSGSASGSACINCHISNASLAATAPTGSPSAGHLNAANNPDHILTAMSAGGAMAGYFNPIASAGQRLSLALFIGQYKAPLPSASTLVTRVNTPATRDVYALLPSDGSSGVAQDSGGVSATNGAHGSTSVNVHNPTAASIRYDLSYSPDANFVGNDSFSYKIINPSAPNPLAHTISVTVVGISSAAAISGATGQALNYTITTNGTPSGATPYSLVSGALPASLTLNPASGLISGTPGNTEAGLYNVTVAVNTTLGSVSKALTFSIDGITSAGSAGGIQNAVFPTYQITSLLTPSAYALIGSLPPGLSFNASNGQISGTAGFSGNFALTMQVSTASGTRQRALSLSIDSAGVPVISSSPVLGNNTPPTVVGTAGSAIAPIQILASNPPINAGSYSASGLPPGLGLNSSSGLISGIPTVGGDFAVTLGASNSSGAATLGVSLRVHSNLAPVITSDANAPAVARGSSGPVYQISASNGPLSSFAVVAPSVLPPGLSLNTSTGLISGSPGTSGLFSSTLSATNSGGLTGSKLVSFTINPTEVPALTSPTALALTAGVAMTPTPILATNPPLLGFGVKAGSTLPPGLSLDPVSGLISGTPSTPGSFTPILTSSNAAGIGERAVPFSVGIPAPGACALSVPLNTATTLDLQPCLFGAFAPSGVAVLAPPAHGTVTVNGTRVTYTPAHNYFGSDTFSAVAAFPGAGVSAAGVVSVTVTGRPDPTQDAAVTGLLTAQDDTARRFSLTQIANYGRHLESLHRASAPGSDAALALAAPAQRAPTRPPPSAVRQLANPDPTQLPVGAAPAPVALPLSTALSLAANELGLSAAPLYPLLTELVQQRTLDLARLAPALGVDGTPGTAGLSNVWVEGVASFGRRDASGALSGSEFSSSGLSVGLDRRYSDQLVLGLGLGLAWDTTRIGEDGSQNQAQAYSLAAYGSYQPAPNLYLDGLLGVGALTFDSQRYVAPLNALALAQRRGQQWFGSLAAGYEFRAPGRLFSPYARLDYVAHHFDDSTESGVGAYALTYFGQTVHSLQATLGVRAESVHATSFGWLLPRLRAEWRHELRDGLDASIAYADQPGGPRYRLAGDARGDSALVLGLGSDFLLRDGWRIGLDYQLSRAFAQDSSFAVRLSISKELDARGLPRLQAAEDSAGADHPWQVDATAVRDDNVSRAKDEADILGDTAYSVTVGRSVDVPLSERTRLLLGASLGGERFQNFNGLSHLSTTLEAEYQFRESSEFSAPTLGLFGRLVGEAYQSDLRDGYRLALGVSLRQPLSDRINAFAALSQNQRHANSAVFNTTEHALRLNLDYALNARATLYLGAEWRRGDIVSSGRATLENVTLAQVLAQDDAFPGGQFFSYRFEGDTRLTTLGYNIGFGPRDALDFSWRHIVATPNARPAWARSPQSYIANQWTLTYLVRF